MRNSSANKSEMILNIFAYILIILITIASSIQFIETHITGKSEIVQAKVTEATMSKHISTIAADGEISFWEEWRIKYKYVFDVDDTKYVGQDRIILLSNNKDKLNIKEVKVYYDKNHPENSHVYDNSTDVMALVFLLIIISSVVLEIHRRRNIKRYYNEK